MASLTQCLECGTELSSAAPEGPCPRCGSSNVRSAAADSALEATRLESLPDTIFADQVTEVVEDGKQEQAVSPGLPPSLAGYMIIGPPKRGGMGTVWPAKQLGTRRIVAIKVLGTRHLTAAGRVRFIREVELSAQLQHANIARIYDSGIHRGDYYYAMEMVEGLPLDEYVKTNKLNQKQILELIRLVCVAVQHAHVRGVIHCDLKPANILVSQDGQPHVLDFGLARLRTTGSDGLTENGSAPGTPSYMSPEQAGGLLDKIDIRTDVYSIGKILYEQLVGRPAHEADGPIGDRLRRIATEPVRLPPGASKKICRELQRILLKSLDRDPEQRYSSGGELASDLERFLQGRPVVAMPASSFYSLRKWVERKWLAVAMAGVAVAVLGTFAGISQYRIARENARTKLINEFSLSMLSIIDPRNSGGRDVTMELLDLARAQSVKLAREPELQADIAIRTGEILLSIGEFGLAEAQFKLAASVREKKLGPSHGGTLEAKELLARVYRERGQLKLAEELCREVLRWQSSKHGEDDPQTLHAKVTLGLVIKDRSLLENAPHAIAEAESLIRDAIAKYALRKNAEDADSLAAWDALVLILRDQKDPQKLEQADALSLRNLERRRAVLGAENIQTLESLHHRASVLTVLGKPSDAIPLYQRSLATATRVMAPSSPLSAGGEHPDLLVWRSDLAGANLAYGLAMQKQFAEAQPDAAFAMMMNYRFAEAEQIYREILPPSMRSRGPDHPFNVVIKKNLAASLAGQAKWAEAEQLFAESAASQAIIRGPEHPETLNLLDYCAWAMTAQQKWREAERIYLQTLQARQKTLSPDDPSIKTSLKRLEIVRSHLAAEAPKESIPNSDQGRRNP